MIAWPVPDRRHAAPERPCTRSSLIRLKRFRAKWTPVRVTKTRQKQESKSFGPDSIRTEALEIGDEIQLTASSKLAVEPFENEVVHGDEILDLAQRVRDA